MSAHRVKVKHVWSMLRSRFIIEVMSFLFHKGLSGKRRCGIVEHLDAHTSRFSADVYDANELIPWIRTFICRITDIQFSNKTLEEQFKNDLGQMYELYGLNDQNEQKGGEKHAI